MASPPTAAEPRRALFYGWRILGFAALTTALTGPGQTVGVSVFIDHFIADLGLTRSEVAIAYLIGTMLGALSLPTVGRIIDRIGVRPAITGIGVTFSIALVAMSGVASFATLALGFVFIRLLGQGSLSLASTVAVTHWFDRRRGLAIGIYTTLGGMLMGLTPVLLNMAIEFTSWRTAWIIAGVVILLTVTPIGWFGIVSYPSDIGEVPDGVVAVAERRETVSAPQRRSYTRAEAARTVPFWIILMAVVMVSTWGTAMNFHQISLLGEAGFSSSAAALMFLPQVAGAGVSALLFGSLADRLQARFLIPAAMGLLATAMLLVSVVSPGLLVVVYAVTLGFAGGSMRSVNATLLPKWFGTGHIGALTGVISFAGVVGSAIGPVTFSLGRDWLGGFASTAATLAFLPIAVAIAAVIFLADSRRAVAARSG